METLERMTGKDYLGRQCLNKDLRKLGIWISGVRDSQENGTAGTKVLRWDHAWCVSETERSVLWLEQHD